MSSSQGWFESDYDYRRRVAQESDERTIKDLTGSTPSQGFFEGDDSYRERISLEANEHRVKVSSESAPSQGWFETDDSYRDRIAREANEHVIRQATGSAPSQGWFESDKDYDTRVRKEANEHIVSRGTCETPKQGLFEGDYEYRRRVAHEAHEVQAHGRSESSATSDASASSYSGGGAYYSGTSYRSISSTFSIGQFIIVVFVILIILGILFLSKNRSDRSVVEDYSPAVNTYIPPVPSENYSGYPSVGRYSQSTQSVIGDYFNKKFRFSVKSADVVDDRIMVNFEITTLTNSDYFFLCSKQNISDSVNSTQKPYIVDSKDLKHEMIGGPMGDILQNAFPDNERGYNPNRTYRFKLLPTATVTGRMEFPMISEGTRKFSLVIPYVNGWQSTIRIDNILLIQVDAHN